ncbi:MAG: hypothetical protein GY917_13220, partial [Planctomycetaceae bacterium]|nr:hypothetical protein [Planctomycetaceae bacterium]
LLLSNQVPPLLFAENSFLGMQKLSLLGLAGFLVSSLLTVRLLQAINKSGRLDRRE